MSLDTEPHWAKERSPWRAQSCHARPLLRPREQAASQTTSTLALVLITLALIGCNSVEDAAAAETEFRGQTRESLTVTLQPGQEGKDSFVFSRPDQTTQPRGDSTLLPALAWTWSGVPGTMRGLIDFDIPPPPAGATLSQATLVLFAETSGTQPRGHSQHTGSNELRVLPVLSPWEESTVTWDTQPGVDDSAALVLPPSTSFDQTYEINVTPFIQRKLAHPTQIHGLMLQLQTEVRYRALQFASSDHANPALRPKLVLEYSTPTATLIGFVRDRNRTSNWNGNPLSGVVVDAGQGHTAITDANGRYVLSNLPLGTYTLRASQAGWTFGSTAFQNQNYTVTLTQAGQSVWAPTILGWYSDPIVFIHGWNSGPGEFSQVDNEFNLHGFHTTTGQLDTSPLQTPTFEKNAQRVKQWVDAAKFETGRNKVVLYGSSMGGLVARAYVEGGSYQGDVSHLFTYGSPHLGVPDIIRWGTGCFDFPRPDALCQMTRPGMSLFNSTHFKRYGVDYHLIAGNAPMKEWREKCFKIFWKKKKICVSYPWPDTQFRNAGGLAMGALIPGPDDGLVQTWSASGQPGTNIDRYLTREVHSFSLGPRYYHDWNNGLPQESFTQCSRHILISGAHSCGDRHWPGPPPGSFLTLSPLGLEGAGVSQAPELTQLSRLEQGLIQAGETKTRFISIEGGPTTFTASWREGTADFILIDPTGRVIDPAYVASLEGDPNDPEMEEVQEPDPDIVLSLPEPTRASYYFPAARPGTWQLVLHGSGGLPPGGTAYMMAAAFVSPLMAEFGSDRLSYDPGSTARLRLTLSEPVQSAEILVTASSADNIWQTLPMVQLSGTEYGVDYELPGFSGYVALDWTMTGLRADGTAFERSGRQSLQLHSTSLRLGHGHTDRAIPHADLQGLNSALGVHLKVVSSYTGADLGVYAELVAPDGRVVSRTVVSAPAQAGENEIELRFPAGDIYRSRADGPYTLRNVKLLDQRDAPLLSQEVEFVHTTGAYLYRTFAPELGNPSVFLEGPFQVMPGESIELTAIAADPEGDALTYAWDLDDDGTFEVSGHPVVFTASSAAAAGVRTIHVRVADPEGNSAEAQALLEIFSPAVNRPPVARCRSVTVPANTACGVSDSVDNGSYEPDVGDAFSCVQTPGGPYPLGSTAVTLTCTDAAGLSSSCEAMVTVVEPEPTTLTLNGDQVMTLECGVDTWVDPGAQAWDACGPLEVHRYNSGSDPYGPGPNANAEGSYSVQYIAWDATGYTVSAIRTVHVDDRTAPSLVLKGPSDMTHTCGSGWVDPGVKAMDACYGDVTAQVVKKGSVNGWVPGTYKVVYELRDSGGNKAQPVTRTVRVSNCPW